MPRTHRTVLLICEGSAEYQFTELIRDYYLPRGCGTNMQRRNAHGFGGEHVLELALTLQAQTGHDAYGVLVDTDVHWSEDNRQKARDSSITVVESSPCLEATLLRVHGNRAYATTNANKHAFEKCYGSAAHQRNILRKHFSKADFDLARSRVDAIDVLLRLLNC